ncbi:hypothetical protein Trydic_g13843 [Trypoxylus dichotomus]
MNLGIVYKPNSNPIKKYVDADWGSSPNDRRSYTGCAFILNGGLISWDAKKQRTVALPSTEAEYMGMTEVSKEATSLRKFMDELSLKNIGNITICNDNLSAQRLAANPTFHRRSKHIDIRYHFILDALDQHLLKIEYIPTTDIVADILTKALPKVKHKKCVETFGLKKPQSLPDRPYIERKCSDI